MNKNKKWLLGLLPLIAACTPQQVAQYVNDSNHDVKVARADSAFTVSAPNGTNGACRVTSIETKEFTRVTWSFDESTQVWFSQDVTEFLPVFDGESQDLCDPDMRAGIVFAEDGLTCLGVNLLGEVYEYQTAPSKFYNYQCPGA